MKAVWRERRSHCKEQVPYAVVFYLDNFQLSETLAGHYHDRGYFRELCPVPLTRGYVPIRPPSQGWTFFMIGAAAAAAAAVEAVTNPFAFVPGCLGIPVDDLTDKGVQMQVYLSKYVCILFSSLGLA